jgi:hypothetical protein
MKFVVMDILTGKHSPTLPQSFMNDTSLMNTVVGYFGVAHYLND